MGTLRRSETISSNFRAEPNSITNLKLNFFDIKSPSSQGDPPFDIRNLEKESVITDVGVFSKLRRFLTCVC